MCVAGGRLRPLGFKAGASAIFEDFWKISARFLGNFWVIPWAFSGPFWHQISSRKLIEKSSDFWSSQGLTGGPLRRPGGGPEAICGCPLGHLGPLGMLCGCRRDSQRFPGDFRELSGRFPGDSGAPFGDHFGTKIAAENRFKNRWIFGDIGIHFGVKFG